MKGYVWAGALERIPVIRCTASETPGDGSPAHIAGSKYCHEFTALHIPFACVHITTWSRKL